MWDEEYLDKFIALLKEKGFNDIQGYLTDSRQEYRIKIKNESKDIVWVIISHRVGEFFSFCTVTTKDGKRTRGKAIRIEFKNIDNKMIPEKTFQVLKESFDV